MSNSIKIKFGEPSHGWLPVKISATDIALEFYASDVPSNPLSSLIDALFRILSGLKTEVWWYLEPRYYLFVFEKDESSIYCLKVFYLLNLNSAPEEIVLEARGDWSAIIVPFWRALREFYSHGYKEPHWPEIDVFKLANLTAIIEAKKKKANKSFERTS